MHVSFALRSALSLSLPGTKPEKDRAGTAGGPGVFIMAPNAPRRAPAGVAPLVGTL